MKQFFYYSALPSPLPFPLPCSETGQRPESSEYVCSLETSVTLACNSTKSLTRFRKCMPVEIIKIIDKHHDKKS